MDRMKQPPRPEDPEVIEPRESLAADDPRAARYRDEYEQRVQAQSELSVQNEEQFEAAKDAYDRAVSANEVAAEKMRVVQGELEAARTELSRQSQLIQNLGPRAGRTLSPAETLRPGEETVLVVFPNAVTLQANVVREDNVIIGTRSATFPEGIQEVPTSLQNHPYLIAHDVRPYGGSRAEPKAKAPAKVVKEPEAA